VNSPVEQKFGKALGQADKLGSAVCADLVTTRSRPVSGRVKTLADGSQARMSEAQFLEMVAK
jgi:hypothetical protein